MNCNGNSAASPTSSKFLKQPPRLVNCHEVALEDEMLLLENISRPPPPPPAPPSTPVIKPHFQSKAVSQKHHHQLLQQLPHMLAHGFRLSRPQDYMWVDPSGRPSSPPRPTNPQNKAQSSRKVLLECISNQFERHAID